jgi:hypothetical protein
MQLFSGFCLLWNGNRGLTWRSDFVIVVLQFALEEALYRAQGTSIERQA